MCLCIARWIREAKKVLNIIGKTEDGYILDASNNEVANLIGYHSDYHMRAETKKTISVGDNIQISVMYQQLYNLKNNEPKLKDTVKMLRGLADSLEPVCPIIEAQIKGATKE
jgi:hypothetical protein